MKQNYYKVLIFIFTVTILKGFYSIFLKPKIYFLKPFKQLSIMSFEFDPSFISHVAVRLDGPFLKSFLSNLENISFQEAESYLSKLIKGNFEQDDFSIGLKFKPDNYNHNELLGHLYKKESFQHISTEIPDIESEHITKEISDFLYSYANVADLQYSTNFLGKLEYKTEKSLDNYIFKELLLQFTNNKNLKYRADGEYFTVINPELSSKYIYYKDNRNIKICKFISKGMCPIYLESFLEQMHSIKIDAEQYFYYGLVNSIFDFNEDYTEFIEMSMNNLNQLVKAYKTILLNKLTFNLYEFLDDDIDSAILNRILKAWHYAHCIIKDSSNPADCLITTPFVLKSL